MKQYVFNGNIYNCELLTENMETKKLFYFLRSVENSKLAILLELTTRTSTISNAIWNLM